ncbi:hypothetical protein [Novosphingobium profundi]|uniref:hypothetical protein n=1 Tax=Novosphingobium profundi TaxID=1774954 RepID=UPI001CFE7B3B|nr:hypothetical protein [Novosphingobium profundi]
MTPSINLTSYRHADWGGSDGSEIVAFLGEDLTQAHFAWSFADRAGGNVLLTLEATTEGLQGLVARYEPDYVHPVSGAVVGATLLIPQIDRETLLALDTPGETGADIVLFHTLYLTRDSGLKHAEFAGNFRIMQGAPN